MDWNAVSAISDFLAAVAVVVSLLYLAKQIRDGSALTAAATHHQITQALTSAFFDIAKDPDLSRIYNQGNMNPESLTIEEIPRYMTMVGVIFGLNNNLYLQHEKGTLEEESWQLVLVSLERLAKSRGVKYWWKYGKHHYLGGFRSIIESNLYPD